MSTASKTGSHPPTASGRAASVLIVRDDPFRVLMVTRRDAGQYASALVFPGGVVDPEDATAEWLPRVIGTEQHDEDARACRIAAARESWEEVALLVATEPRDSARLHTPLSAPRRDLGLSFADLVHELGLQIDLDALHFFGRWLTPVDMPKRWHTEFLLARAPEGAEPEIDDDEVVSAAWLEPGEVLERHGRGEQDLWFPTLLNLRRLAEADSVTDAIRRASHYPRVTAAVEAERRPGGVLRRIPAEAGYGITELWMPNPS